MQPRIPLAGGGNFDVKHAFFSEGVVPITPP